MTKSDCKSNRPSKGKKAEDAKETLAETPVQLKVSCKRRLLGHREKKKRGRN